MEQMENLLNGFEEPPYSYVGFAPRLAALFIDGIILVAVSYLLRLPLKELGNHVVMLIVTFIIPLLYSLILEYKYGATLGKMLLRIKIVNYELQPPSMSNIILRNIIYICLQFVSFGIDLNSYFKSYSSDPFEFMGFNSYFTPEVMIGLIYSACVIVIYTIEMLFLLKDPKYRALHDRIGKTYVVKSLV